MPYFIDESEWLAHYGVKGMKWGQHLFGRDRGGSGRKVGKAQSSPPPLNSKAAFANLWSTADRKKQQDEEAYTAKKHRQFLRDMRWEEYEKRFGDNLAELSTESQKLEKNRVYASADIEAALDDIKISYSDEKYKTYVKSVENWCNALTKEHAALAAEYREANDRNQYNRVFAIDQQSYNLYTEWGRNCQNLFIGTDAVKLTWEKEPASFKFYGKTLRNLKARCEPIPPGEDPNKYRDEMWNMQSMFDPLYTMV